MAQLVERSLPIPEVRGSNPVIAKIYLYRTFVSCQLCIEKTQIKKKEAGNGPFFKQLKQSCVLPIDIIQLFNFILGPSTSTLKTHLFYMKVNQEQAAKYCDSLGGHIPILNSQSGIPFV